MKNRSIQEDSDDKDNDKEESFVRGSEQTWYDEPLYIINPLIDMLFLNEETIRKENLMCIQMSRHEIGRKALVDSECTYMGIDKQLVKEKQIKIEPMNRSFRVFNTDRTKNEEVTRFVLLELEINRHIEKIDIVVTDLNSINMFLGYNWLIKYNPEVNWGKGTIQFIRYCYNSKILKWVNMKNLILGLIQENSIENSVQNCLPFIPKLHSTC